MTDAQETDKPRVSRSGRILRKSLKLREFEEDMLDPAVTHKLSSQKRKISRRERQFTSHHSSDTNDSLKSSEYSDDESEESLSPVSVTRTNETEWSEPVHSAGRKSVPGKDPSFYSSHPETDLSCSTIELSSSSNTSVLDPEPGAEQNHGTESLNDDSFGSDHDPKESEAHQGKRNQRKVGAKRRKVYETDPEFVLQKGLVGKKGNRGKNRNSSAKKKGRPMITSYTLWRMENKRKIEAMFIDNPPKKVTEIWRALPETEKVLWKRKAKQLALRSSMVNSRALNSSPPNTVEQEMKEHSEEPPSIGLTPIDSAARLKLLGDCLITLGMKLVTMDCQPVATGVYSVLLDSLLCSMVPLLSLTREISGLENLPDEVFFKMSDHIAYFLPGL